jgi:hypothetical protein
VLRDRLLATVPPCDAERTPAPLLPGGPELLALLGGPVPPTPAGACPIPAAAWTSVRALLPARGDPGWHSSVHWAWLEILDGLLAPPSGRGAAVEAWAARRRDAALVAWAALHRRAGFVSAARSPTDPFPAPPASADGRVEGDPPTFARLEALVRAARAGLADLRLVEADGEVAGILDAWADRLALLSEGAIAAVEGRPPGEAAARAAGAFAEEAEALLRRLTRLDRSGSVTEIDVRIPFEVETASRAGRVRREGAGPIGLLVVRVPDAAGGFTAAVGPAARPINER